MPNKKETKQASAEFNFVAAIASYFGKYYTDFTKELAHSSHSGAVKWVRKGELPPWRRQDIADAARVLPKSDRAQINDLLDWGIS